ncbi:MAG: type I 3-dehydroquinate dehydratase [Prevotellaceae bacterium]|jgi:3-dehydroquinate dehydratase type I|nr:type I 3-dehydroquinate dehydratase [Prevotellaceae bacterium]
MICVSIIEQDIKKCISILQKCEMAELRLDKIKPEPNEIKKLLMFEIPLIATCRTGIYNDDERLKLLTVAAKNGATYIDIELESDENYRKKLIDVARSFNRKIIISYHNFNETPDIDILKNIISQAGIFNPDFIKIVTRAQKIDDISIILSLYETEKRLIAFSMGELGKKTRIKSLELGAPFIYAACEEGRQSAEGQMTVEELNKILNNEKICTCRETGITQ